MPRPEDSESVSMMSAAIDVVRTIAGNVIVCTLAAWPTKAVRSAELSPDWNVTTLAVAAVLLRITRSRPVLKRMTLPAQAFAAGAAATVNVIVVLLGKLV